MNDTSRHFTQMLEEKYRQVSSDERIEMATSMFECAREIVISSIKNASPSISELDRQKEIFLRFYENDYSDLQERNRILESLRLG